MQEEYKNIRYALSDKAENLGIVFKKAHRGDAGLDLRATKETLLYPNTIITVGTGISIEIPDGYVGIIKDKSSLAKDGVHVLGGVIDSSYRGEIFVILTWLNQDMSSDIPYYYFKEGDKIAQLVIFPIINDKFVTLTKIKNDELSKTDRGINGFGSTGR